MPTPARFLAPAAAALALAAPAAQGRPAADAYHVVPARVGAPALSAQRASDGFDWGSAAIGAGSVTGLIVLLSAGAAAAWRIRVPSPR